MTFFADEPDPFDGAPGDGDGGRDPRHGPPEDELPAVIGYGIRWAVSEYAVIVVESAQVFSDGVLFHVDRQLRRKDLSRRQFQQLVHEDFFYETDDDRRARLRYGAILPDGRTLTDSHPFSVDAADDGAVLTRNGGSGGGGASSYRYRDELWLHSLPPAGPLELVVQWPALHVHEHRITLPTRDLLHATEQVTNLWAD